MGECVLWNNIALTDFVLPKNMAEIPSCMFSNCYSFKKIIIPDTITSIGEYAFDSCYYLQAIYIPNTVSEIKDYAFNQCGAYLDTLGIDVYYESGLDDWQKISIGDNNETYKNWIMHYDVTPEDICLEHSLLYVEMQDPTCETEGHNGYWICSICGKPFRDPYSISEISLDETVIPAFGHDWSYSTITSEPTCTEQGIRTYICQHNSEHTKTESIPATGHNWNTATYAWSDDHSACVATRVCRNNPLHIETATASVTASTQAAGCTTTGKTAYTANFSEDWCAAQTAEVVLPATGHNWSDWTVTKPATETETGIESRTCATCGETETREIPVLTHVHNLSAVPAQSPTCEDAGHTAYWICSSCGRWFSDAAGQNEITQADTVITATGHSWSDWNVTKPATTTETGIESRSCSLCGLTETRTVPVIPDDPKPTNPFSDVSDNAYYYAPVLWAVNHKPQITNGTSSDTFSPDATCTRAQVVTFLWRAMGEPEPTSTKNPFKDVASNAYYYKAVLWAVENNITSGTGKTAFSPDNPCTRGQVATFLWRTNKEPEASGSNPFTDVTAKAYYYKAVLWAVANEITNGTGTKTFSPDNPCTRGQIVTFLYRALK